MLVKPPVSELANIDKGLQNPNTLSPRQPLGKMAFFHPFCILVHVATYNNNNESYY